MADRLVNKPGDGTVAANDSSSNTVLDSNLENLKSFVEELSPECINNEYILVIGSEAVLAENVIANGDSLAYLYKLTTDYLLNKHIITAETADECKDFTQLTHKMKFDTWSHVYNMTISHKDDQAFDTNKIEKSLIDLLETKCFRIVLTTTIDPFVEKAMERVWGKNNYIVKSLWSTAGPKINVQKINNQDIDDKDLKPGEFNEIKPILYYAFGNIKNQKNKAKNKAKNKDKPSHKSYVLTENDAMQAVSEWFSSSGPQNLRKYIRANKVLSIGCRFDDWLFRFFWFILIGDVENLDSGQVVVELDENKDKDKRLLKFLNNEEIGHFDNARTFMKYLSEAINTSLNLGEVPVTYGRGVFISYASKDFCIAMDLFITLRNEGINVWFDKDKIEGGDEVEKRIKDAIGACKVFIPILSTQVKNDLNNGLNEKDRYYMKEWKWAEERYKDNNCLNRMMILPIIVGRDNERKHFFGNEHLDSILNEIGVHEAHDRADTGELVDRIRKMTN